MYVKGSKEHTVALALHSIAHYTSQIALDQTISIDDKIKTLQWIHRKIPEINRLLVRIKTEQIQLKPRA